MSVIARNWTIYVCPACRHLSGKAGHIGCVAEDGTPQPEPVEYVRAIAIQGAVDLLRRWLDADDEAERDYTDERQAHLDAVVAEVRAYLGGQ